MIILPIGKYDLVLFMWMITLAPFTMNFANITILLTCHRKIVDSKGDLTE